MNARPFYFASIRNLTAAFGSLFNEIYVQRYDNTGKQHDLIKVPLAYAPGDKTVIMLQQRNPQVQQNKTDIKVVLPRLAFELTGMSYDPTRKSQTLNKVTFPSSPDVTFAPSAVNTTNSTITLTNHGLSTGRSLTYIAGTTSIGGLTSGTSYYVIKVDNNTISLAINATAANESSKITLTSAGSGTATLKFPFAYQYNPVPYNFEFSLYAFVKYIDDGLQIVEQIVPYFTPFYTVTLNDVPAYGLKRDVPISLTSITSEDQYQGDVAEDRIITWTFTFSAAGWVYPPVKDSSGIIKNIDVNFKDLDYEQTLTTVNVTIDPITANKDDTYEIITTITEGN
jgi:hypothetical protein